MGLLISVRKAGVLCKGRFGVLLGNRHFKHTQGYQKIKKFWLGEKGKGCVLTESFVFWWCNCNSCVLITQWFLTKQVELKVGTGYKYIWTKWRSRFHRIICFKIHKKNWWSAAFSLSRPLVCLNLSIVIGYLEAGAVDSGGF